jgi:MSHA pilin protein MshD
MPAFVMPSKAAFTLVEAAMSVLIVGVMLVAALQTIGASARDSVLQHEQCKATALAEQLLTEIVQCRYTDPNEESGETRATWDDVSDYHGLNEDPPLSRKGIPLAGYTGWQRTVTVRLADPNNLSSQPGSDLGLKAITVTVVSPAGKSTTLTALRSTNSIYERQAQAQTTYTSWVDIAVQVGSDTQAKSIVGVNLINEVP